MSTTERRTCEAWISRVLSRTLLTIGCLETSHCVLILPSVFTLAVKGARMCYTAARLMQSTMQDVVSGTLACGNLPEVYKKAGA